ncbi:MAG: asparagine synthetase [Thelocarpon impressellum]|nr:MAG: asparagine synthetase [Thelocarpon impressellum]
MPVYYERLRLTLEKAVGKRVVEHTPYDMLLSGGLDFSFIASIAIRTHTQAPLPGSGGCSPAESIVGGSSTSTMGTAGWLRTFSIGLAGSPDIKAAQVVADFLRTDHHAFTYTIDEGLDAIRARKIKALGVKVVLSGEGSDESFGGYLYFKNLSDAAAFHCESVRRVEDLHLLDNLRANKSTPAKGLEARVPFLDKQFVQVAMSIEPCEKMADDLRMEKYILRKASDVADGEGAEPKLPDSILWRQKEQFNDSVGYGWIDALKKQVEKLVSDEGMHSPPSA